MQRENPVPPILKAKSKVIIIFRNGIAKLRGKDLSENLSAMITAGIERLTSKNVRDSWCQFFNAGDRVGVKVNTLAGRGISTHPELAQSVAEHLHNHVGIPQGNIIIWDRENAELIRAGFALSRGKKFFQCFGTDEQGVGYHEDLFSNGRCLWPFKQNTH